MNNDKETRRTRRPDSQPPTSKLLWGGRTFVPKLNPSHFERMVLCSKSSSLTKREGCDKGTSGFERNNWMKSPRLENKPLETLEAS